ncbi:hypothetical protein FQN53_002051 [Emmonsiellopsis sp. PD_33]|nr:hypothetical protein FQN53_002051 [Emmonsiellopsis sp. PD_33]KAK2798045.1 hypothetical protein FQN51_007970 [Onygenales sp. PD_10]
MPSSLLRTGQALRGGLGQYTITAQIRETVWLAKNQAQETVVIKGVRDHPRVEHELAILKTFQSKTSSLRPLIDEIDKDPSEPVLIVLKHLDDDLLRSLKKRALNRKELKFVSSRVLEALKVLHEAGYAHTDVKPDNVFVNYRDKEAENGMRFSEVQLGDLGSTYRADCRWAKSGTPLGAPMWRSPEMIMETPWGTPSDVWSFGAVLISLIYGDDFNLFDPTTIPYGHEEYNLEVLKRQFQYFGPWPGKYEEVANPETVQAIQWIMQEIPKSKTTPFSMITEREVCRKDKESIGKIMMMDWRDRPTARELLEDEWFMEA